MAFKRVRGFWFDTVYVIPAAGDGPPREITSGGVGVWGHAWLPAGDGLIVSTQRGGHLFGLWAFGLTPGPEPPVRINGGGLDAVSPASGRGGGRIAWVNLLDDTNIHRVPLVHSESESTEIVSSTRRDQSASYSPDGRIAFVSDRSGSWTHWGNSRARV